MVREKEVFCQPYQERQEENMQITHKNRDKAVAEPRSARIRYDTRMSIAKQVTKNINAMTRDLSRGILKQVAELVTETGSKP